jgi:hypothetical protein
MRVLVERISTPLYGSVVLAGFGVSFIVRIPVGDACVLGRELRQVAAECERLELPRR